MAKHKKIKKHEKEINTVYISDGMDTVIENILGISPLPISTFEKYFDKKERINIPPKILTKFEASDLKNLPNYKLNVEKFDADTDWLTKDGELTFINEDEYKPLIEKAVDTIFPYGNEDKNDLIPVTILLPNVNPLEEDDEYIDDVSNNYSYWEFINIKNGNDGDKKGFQTLAEDTNSYFGLRLFLALKSLGLINIYQTEKNTSKTFIDILKSTPLSKHFKLLDGEEVKKYTDGIDEIKKLENKIKELQKSQNNTGIGEIKKINKSIEEISNEISEIIKSTLCIKVEKALSKFYYSLPIENLSSLDKNKFDLDPEEDVVLPALKLNMKHPRIYNK